MSWGEGGVGMRVRYLGSGGCRRGRGRKGRGVVVFDLSEGCVGYFSAGVSLSLSLAWEGRWC